MRKVFVLIILLFSFSFANAEENVMNFLKSNIDSVINIYNSDKQESIKKEELKKFAYNIFDFTIISRLALARKWKEFTDNEKSLFEKEFSNLLLDTYYDKMKPETAKKITVTINYLSQELISDTKAIVKTNIPNENNFIPIDYKLLKTNNVWKIYDVDVEGISLIKNYREQFAEFLMTKTPLDLIEKLKTMKVEKTKK